MSANGQQANGAGPYPVLVEQPLGRAQRRLLSRARDTAELPQAEPGTVLVFESGTGHVAFTERRHLGGREELVVNAVSVSLIDIRPRTVTVSFLLHSRSAADDFTVRADFRCLVEEPETVAAAGLHDLPGTLRIYLTQDTRIHQLTASRSIEDINRVRSEVIAHIKAYCKLRAPRIPGMAVDLLNVRVHTPGDLATFERQLRDETWRQRRHELENSGEDRDIARMLTYVEAGPESREALAIVRNQLNLAEAHERALAERAEKRQSVLKLLEALPEGATDTLAVDSERIVDMVMDEFLGPPPTPPSIGSSETAADRIAGPGSASGHE